VQVTQWQSRQAIDKQAENSISGDQGRNGGKGSGKGRIFSEIPAVGVVTIGIVSSCTFFRVALSMIALLQRVTRASVTVDDETIAAIGSGLLVFVGVQPADTEATAQALLQRITRYRVFSDAQGRMNLSLLDSGGALLLVPQFTLAADTRKGLRPGFSTAATPEEGSRLFDAMVALAEGLDCESGCGRFGANMQVELVNDGPATFWLQQSPE